MKNYTIKKSTRAKNLRITIRQDESITVTIPHRMSVVRAEEFVREKEGWIQKVLQGLRMRPKPAYKLPKASKENYELHKREALRIAEEKLEHWNALYQTTWNRVTIKNTTSRWGSCSQLRNLNFSYRLAFLPEHLRDYLIVHELCHLMEMNHSVRFWKLVGKAIPDYVTRRQELRGLH